MGKMRSFLEDEEDRYIDLSLMDFEALAKKFSSRPTKHTEVEKLKSLVQRKITQLLIQNHTRMNYQEEFHR